MLVTRGWQHACGVVNWLTSSRMRIRWASAGAALGGDRHQRHPDGLGRRARLDALGDRLAVEAPALLRRHHRHPRPADREGRRRRRAHDPGERRLHRRDDRVAVEPHGDLATLGLEAQGAEQRRAPDEGRPTGAAHGHRAVGERPPPARRPAAPPRRSPPAAPPRSAPRPGAAAPPGAAAARPGRPRARPPPPRSRACLNEQRPWRGPRGGRRARRSRRPARRGRWGRAGSAAAGRGCARARRSR